MVRPRQTVCLQPRSLGRMAVTLKCQFYQTLPAKILGIWAIGLCWAISMVTEKPTFCGTTKTQVVDLRATAFCGLATGMVRFQFYQTLPAKILGIWAIGLCLAISM